MTGFGAKVSSDEQQQNGRLSTLLTLWASRCEIGGSRPYLGHSPVFSQARGARGHLPTLNPPLTTAWPAVRARRALVSVQNDDAIVSIMEWARAPIARCTRSTAPRTVPPLPA